MKPSGKVREDFVAQCRLALCSVFRKEYAQLDENLSTNFVKEDESGNNGCSVLAENCSRPAIFPSKEFPRFPSCEWKKISATRAAHYTLDRFFQLTLQLSNPLRFREIRNANRGGSNLTCVFTLAK